MKCSRPGVHNFMKKFHILGDEVMIVINTQMKKLFRPPSEKKLMDFWNIYLKRIHQKFNEQMIINSSITKA